SRLAGLAYGNNGPVPGGPQRSRALPALLPGCRLVADTTVDAPLDRPALENAPSPSGPAETPSLYMLADSADDAAVVVVGQTGTLFDTRAARLLDSRGSFAHPSTTSLGTFAFGAIGSGRDRRGDHGLPIYFVAP